MFALNTILCNTAICLIFNLFSTYHTKHILDRKDFYWDVTRLRARAKRNEMEWNNKFQANLMSNNPFEILNLRCFKWFTSLATLQDQTPFIKYEELFFFLTTTRAHIWDCSGRFYWILCKFWHPHTYSFSNTQTFFF